MHPFVATLVLLIGLIIHLTHYRLLLCLSIDFRLPRGYSLGCPLLFIIIIIILNYPFPSPQIELGKKKKKELPLRNANGVRDNLVKKMWGYLESDF